MKTGEFVIQEVKGLVRVECNQFLEQSKNKDLIEKINNLSFDSLMDMDEPNTEFKELDVFLSRSQRFLFIKDQFRKKAEGEFSLVDVDLIRKKIKSDPNNRLYPFLWANQMVNLFDREEFFESEIVGFLKELLNKYEYLIELDDFFESIGLFSRLFHSDRLKRNKDILLPILQHATNSYPNKIILNICLAKIYYFNGDYEKSFLLANSSREYLHANFRTTLEINLDDFNGNYYLGLIEFIAMIYNKLGDFDKVLENVNFVITNATPIKITNETGEETIDEDIETYLNSYLLRMRANMMKDNVGEVKADYNKVISIIAEFDEYSKEEPWKYWKEYFDLIKAEYDDVLKFAEENIN